MVVVIKAKSVIYHIISNINFYQAYAVKGIQREGGICFVPTEFLVILQQNDPFFIITV